ncbi:MAG: TolC family outer membrane protein [Gammaproteobacteria bacterium]
MIFKPAVSLRRVVRALAFVALLGFGATLALQARAENLMQAYLQAVQSDPILKEAEAGQRIGQAGAALARAPLLPQISAGISYSDAHGNYVGPQLVNTPNGPQFMNVESGIGGRSRSDEIGLDQKLFDLGSYQQLSASNASAAAATSLLSFAQQDLILRVAQAYFNVLTDEDQVKFANANVRFLKKQLEQAQTEYKIGFTTITNVADAQASYDSARATVITDQNALFNDRQALEQITGQPVDTLSVLTATLPLHQPQPDNMNDWVNTALANNPALAAQRHQAAAAEHQVSAASAQRVPTINGSVSYSRTPSWATLGNPGAGASARTPQGDSRTAETIVGVVLSLPIFSGGGIQAQVDQASAEYDQANDVLEQDRRTTVSNARNAFNAVIAGISSVTAEKAAVASAKTALEATQAGFDVGKNTIVDLLLAQSTYFQALSAYSQARHAYVIDQLSLKFTAGKLSMQDLEAVNDLLQ